MYLVVATDTKYGVPTLETTTSCSLPHWISWPPILVTEILGEVEVNLVVDEIANFVNSCLHNIYHLTSAL